MAIKMLVFDMDGTLLNGEGILTERTAEALRRASACGVKVILASGRMPCAMRKFSERLGLTDPMINYNGAMITDPATLQPLDMIPVEADLARELCAFAEGRGLYVQGYKDDTFFAEKETEWSILYKNALKNTVAFRATGEKLSSCISEPNPKLMVIDNPDRIREELPVFRAAFAGRLNCVISQPRYIEFTHVDANKGEGLKRLCALVGIDLSEVASFGDSQNDAEMLKITGRSYAMGNARPEIKAMCTHQAPPNTEDGVAQVVEALIASGFAD